MDEKDKSSIRINAICLAYYSDPALFKCAGYPLLSKLYADWDLRAGLGPLVGFSCCTSFNQSQFFIG